MKIEAIDLFYVALLKIKAAADGSQDTLPVRVRADNSLCGRGESDSPLILGLTAPTGLPIDENGLVDCPQTPGRRVDVNLDTVREYLQPVRIEVGGKLIHETPEV